MDEPPIEFMCPITMEIMRCPMIAGDGYTYESANIKKWIDLRGTSPITRERLSVHELMYNKEIAKQIVMRYAYLLEVVDLTL